jgi:hypothetical protein
MRRHFSFQRLAIIVAWAALSPQCALLVHSWIGLLPEATVSDAAGIVPDSAGNSNRSSDRPGTVARNTVARNAAAQGFRSENTITEKTTTEITVSDRVRPAALDRRPNKSWPGASDQRPSSWWLVES